MTSATITSTPTTADSTRKILPVTIITGFLGSGKTTLLNHILTNQQGLKTAVLVNEFGEIGIDNDLIVATSADNTMVELSNGCVCCTMNEDMVNEVYKIINRPDIDYLVVETTGLADPVPLALTFLGTELRDMTRLDSIITLIDSANFSIDLFNSEAALNQIIYGDILLLNKTDLVDEADVDLLEVRIRDMKTGARILRTQNSEVPLPMVLSVGLFESDKYVEKTDHQDHDHDHSHDHQAHSHDAHSHDHKAHSHDGHDHAAHSHDDHSACDHDHGKCTHDDHAHDEHAHQDHRHSDHLAQDGFTSLSFQSDRPFSLKKFQDFLDNHLDEGVFRAKGLLWFSESPNCHIFHLCGKRFSIDDQEWKDLPSNKLVLIGQNLDSTKIRQQLNACLSIPRTTAGKGFGK
jgi:G3E family GTPase